MDPVAELTLRLVRVAQEHRSRRPSISGWLLVPDFRRLSWEEAQELLAAAPVPGTTLGAWVASGVGLAAVDWGLWLR